MKQLILILVIIFALAVNAEARTEKCYWIWSTDVTTANDGPDSVYCDKNGDGTFQSKGTAYIQNSLGADSVTVIYDSTWNNSNTVPEIPDTITPCSNTASTGDLNVLTCAKAATAICSTGTTTVAYHQTDDIADNIKDGYELTPPAAFDLSVDGDTATCWVVITITNWK
jgi:hypothetical protein